MSRRNRRAPVSHTEGPPESSGSETVVPEAELCGYRLVRVLDSTSVSTSWLAVPVSHGTPPDRAHDSGPRAVELTRYHTPAAANPAPDLAFTDLSPHVYRALDVATDDDGGLVVIAEHTERTLAALLDERPSLSRGEAVTVLAPTARGLAALHRAGWCHGALTPAAVALTPDGRPVLTRLADASIRRPHGPPGETLRRADLGALRTLIDDVLGSSVNADDESVASLLRWIDRTVAGDTDGDTFLAQLDLRLFGLAEPLPIDLRARPETTDAAEAMRFAPVGARRQAEATDPSGDGWLTRVLAGAGLDSLAELVDSVRLSRIPVGSLGVLAWARRALRGRAAVIVASTAVAVFGVWGGLALIPETGRAAAPATMSDVRTTSSAPAEHSAPVTLTAPEEAALGADDPVAALDVLLALRSRCLAGLSTECVSLVDEPGSAAEATDLHAIATGGVAPLATPLDPATPRSAELVQRSGDAVLFRLIDPADTANQPVLVLVMRTDTGWRLRDLSDPDGLSN